ncbi:succinate dehydrogenase, hydrophobic membrane anchor protein [Rhodosalinus halophilus]|uniref:Succinate dehydrogenase hydrophobic membrane anchor subunit n=1 Tax=Rhodosalinus halophilus TaxID=2259333 RepID=A0A365U6Y6_9RHOB|nr:succinate dehydrogenase, hydrophobic membrane anchor protein [Rhodosalinus halophilus]RBI84091.1 succinate dehydrogenase, hydrophobic membrane anchor protein [Rhodosalinus halophilus]
MRILTARKRAEGLGAAKSGTEHHWSMIVSSAALIGLIPAFVFTFGQALGGTHEEVIAYYQRPFPAIVAILTFLVGFIHFRGGVQTMIEDYVHGTRQKVLIVLAICLAYAAAATGIFAVAKIAL